MKKIISAACAFTVIAFNASAQSLLFRTDTHTANTDAAVVFFKADNTISSVINTTAEVCDDGYIIRDVELKDDEKKFKLFLADGSTAITGNVYTESTNVSDFNTDLYPDDGALLFAPAMVMKVRQVFADEELKYELTLLYQGKEQTFTFDNTLKITSASDSLASAINNDVSYLKPGDAIILNHAFKNDPRSITFVYRPSAAEPVFDASITDFSPLFTSGTGTRSELALYNFGVVTDVGSSYIILQEKDGSDANSKTVSFHPEASVYIFDAREKTEPYTYFASGIFPSYIDNADVDQNGNILTWQPSDNRTYALARIYNDIATDILVYEY